MKRRMVLWVLVVFLSEIRALCATVPRVAGQWPGIPAGDVIDLTALGNTLFAKLRDANCAVIDIGDPGQIRRVGTIRNEAVRITSAGPYLMEYFAGPLRLLDMTERTSPTVIARMDGIFPAATAAWPFVYARAEAPELAIYDFRNPTNPVRVPATDVAGSWLRLKTEGNVLAGLDIPPEGAGTLWFFDITNREKPARRGSWTNIYQGTPIEMRAQYVFIGNAATLEILDISDLAHPRKVGDWSSGFLPGVPALGPLIIDIAVVGDFLWVSLANAGVQILDARNPAEPKPVAFISGVAYASHALVGTHLFYGDYKGVTAFDVANPESPIEEKAVLTGAYFGKTTLFGDGLLLLHNWHAPTPLLDIKSPDRPQVVQELAASYSAEVVGDKVFFLDTKKVLHLYSAGNGPKLQEMSRLGFYGDVGISMASDAQHLFVPASNTVKVVNFSDPQAMRVEASVSLPAANVKIARMGTRLAATSSRVDSYLSIVDISDAAHPRVTATVTNQSYLGNVVATNNAIYICSLDFMYVIELTAAGELIGHAPIEVDVVDAAISGQRLVALTGGGLRIYNISDPFAPTLVGEVTDLPINMARLTVGGDYAYIAGGQSGLITVQIAGTPPALPTLNIAHEGEMHRVRWSADFNGFTFMSAPTINGPWTTEPWRNVSRWFNETTFANKSAARFYRVEP